MSKVDIKCLGWTLNVLGGHQMSKVDIKCLWITHPI